jgi:YD repeat-containing protein
MRERQFTRSCPHCGAASPLSAPACLRCNHSFSPAPIGQTATSYKKAASWIAGVLLALALLFIVAFVGLLHAHLSSTTTYLEALKLAKGSPAVQAALGENIHLRSTAIGIALSYSGSDFVEFSVSLGGSHGAGRLYAVANSTNRSFQFSRLSFLPAAATQPIDLTPAPQRLDLPPVPVKKVYLTPLGLDADEPLDWAPSYYQAKFGIEVAVLPPATLTEHLMSPNRKQVDSEACIEYLRKLHPELDADPSAILIAVTSKDIYIPSFNWAYAENYRQGARFAVVSSARLHPPAFMASWNPEWLHSRLQKMLTKNVAMLYFDLPMSSDYTSLLSGGVLLGPQIDFMGGAIIGAEGKWDSFINGDDPGVTIYSVPGKPPLWRLIESNDAVPQHGAHVFRADLGAGLFIDRAQDFLLEGEYPLSFTRSYRNADRISRSFGIGASDSLDIFLSGEMGVYVDLIFEDGGRLHFVHSRPGPGVFGDAYRANSALAVYAGDGWTVTMHDGSKLYFPYRPNYLGYNVTVLTGYTDPAGHKYEMERNSSGELLSVTTPVGQWLHFERDAQHRVHRISASTGRVLTYDYDPRGCLSKVADSDGHTDSYTYDDKFQMLTVARDSDPPIITNEYDSGQIISQTLASGERFLYHYTSEPEGRRNVMLPDLITDPRGLVTFFVYNSEGYIQSLPQRGERQEPLHK